MQAEGLNNAFKKFQCIQIKYVGLLKTDKVKKSFKSKNANYILEIYYNKLVLV